MPILLVSHDYNSEQGVCMRVLVTGGAGFIGANLVEALIRDNEVVVVDDLSTGSADNVHPDARFAQMSILDEKFLAEVASFKPDKVVHLAAQASVGASIVDPHNDWLVNVEGTKAVARAARSCGARAVISASSAAVYGTPAELPICESRHKLPTNPYGRSKLAAEEVLASELSRTGTDFASFRFSNVYGPRQSSQGEGGVVAIFASRLVRGEELVVFGDGSQTRDFIFVADVVDSICLALKTETRLCEGGGDGPAYNISTGTQMSITQLIEALSQISGVEAKVSHEPAIPGDIKHSVLDARKADSIFGWEARIPFETGLEATYAWYLSSVSAPTPGDE